FNASKTIVNFDEEKTSLEQIEKAITRMGYPVLSSKVKAA
ncbi:MAG: metal-binding protein, partial [Bacteroidales bacterium]|nr:metal-binding protein [Bacteroidales bacterium]